MLMNKLTQKLIVMMQQDQLDMNDLSVRKKNARQLQAIITKHGWPTIELVGEEASNASWLIAQHADHNLEFQKQCLDLMKRLPKKSVLSKNIAYLTDRILVSQNKPQKYGTQFYIVNNELKPRPIKDRQNIDKRWQKMNVGGNTWRTFEEYQKNMEEIHKTRK